LARASCGIRKFEFSLHLRRPFIELKNSLHAYIRLMFAPGAIGVARKAHRSKRGAIAVPAIDQSAA
jgi:hypothetical protein